MGQLWAITGDWQLDSNPPFDRKIDGRSLRFDDSVEQVRRLLRHSKEQGATHLKFLGDATEHKNADNLERTTLSHLFMEASEIFPQGIDAIPGNHDGSLYALTSSTLEPIGILLDKVKYYDTFSWCADGLRCYVFLPYLHGVTEGAIAKLFEDFFDENGGSFKEFYLFGHYGIQGVKSGASNQLLVKDLLALETIQAHRFKRIWMGHIHKHQWIKNAGFPGSTYSHDYGERLDKKGYILYSPDNDYQEFIPLQQKHRLMQVDYMQLDDELYVDTSISSEIYKDAIVKLVGYVPSQEDAAWPNIEKMFVNLLTKKMGAVAVFPEVERERIYRESRSTVSTAQSLKEALQVYIHENAESLGISDIDAVTARGWEILEEQPEFRSQYSDVKLKSIRFINLLSFVDETFIFENGIHLISALNGTGKSNALGGLFLAITGEAMTGVNLAALVRQETNVGEVLLEFSAGGDNYDLRRVLTINKSKGNATQKVFLTCNGVDVKDGGNKEVQNKAEALIGLDSLAFRNTVFFVQDDPESIIYSPGRERKEVVMSVLRMATIGAAWETVGKLIKIENQRISILKTKKETLDAIVFDASREELEKERFVKEKERTDLTDQQRQGENAVASLDLALNESRVEYLQLFQEYSKKGDIHSRPKILAETWEVTKARYEKDLSDLRLRRDSSFNLIKVWTEEISLKDKEASETAQKMDLLKTGEREILLKEIRERNLAFDHERELIYEYRSQLNVKSQRLLELNAYAGMGNCPTCGQDTKHLHDQGIAARNTLENEIHNLREGLSKKDIAQKSFSVKTLEIQENAEQILEKENELSREVTRIRSRIESLRALISREEATNSETIATGKNTRADYSQQTVSFTESYQKALAEAAKAQLELERLTGVLAECKKNIETMESSREAILGAVRICVNKQGPLNVRIGVIESQLTQMDNILKEKREVEFAWMAAAKDLKILEPLRKVFSPEGIQAALIESARPDLERRINYYLSALRVSKFRIQIETQAESESSGNIKETFDLLVDNGALPMLDVRSYSGGEKNVIKIAIHLALSDLAFERSGIKFPFFALDEVYDGLDAEKCRALTGLIFNLSADIVLVVCHIASVAGEYDSVIEGSWTREDGTRFQKKALPQRGQDDVVEQVQNTEAGKNKGGNKGKGIKR